MNIVERQFKSDSEAYEVFVGTIPPQEFVAPFDGDIEDAVANLIENWEYDETPPSWLEDALSRYVSSALAEDA